MRSDTYKTLFVEEMPYPLERGILYIEGTPDSKCCLAGLLCPCGCEESNHMSFLVGKEHQPRVWKMDNHPDGSVSLTPSILRIGNCGSHFFLKNGRVQWC